MLERYKIFQPKPNTTDELKKVFANNMGLSTTELQQGRTEFYQKTSLLIKLSIMQIAQGYQSCTH